MAKQNKIGIFTYMLNNYGAVLQSFALQHYLQTNGAADVEIVNFETIRHQQLNKIFRKYSDNFLVQLCFIMLTLLRYKQLKQRKIKTLLFKRKYMKFTRVYTSQTDLFSNLPEKDVYVSGSDQVFNPNGLNRDVYYLNFEKGRSKKVAYAPSWGTSVFSQITVDIIKKHISDFDALSCREEDGADMMSKLLGKDIPTVADPTLLLSQDEWLAVAELPRYKKNYICIYDLNGAEHLITIAKQIQRRTSFDIVCITNKIQKFYDVNKQIYSAGPAEFVGWIANAKYVVTDSFHGMMFSLIFRRPFYIYIAVPASSARIRSILSRFDLLDMIVENNESDSFVFKALPLHDYSQLLEDFTSISKAYIQNYILEQR